VRGLRLRIDPILTGRMGRARRDDDFVMALVCPSPPPPLLFYSHARFVKKRKGKIKTIFTTSVFTKFLEVQLVV